VICVSSIGHLFSPVVFDDLGVPIRGSWQARDRSRGNAANTARSAHDRDS
jgi:hypothetical protein